MKPIAYDNQLNQVVDAWRQRDIFADAEVHRNFSFCCANLKHFRPDIPTLRMPSIFRGIATRQTLAALDIQCGALHESVTLTGWDEEWVEEIRRVPGIICTYHTGSYRLVCRLMASAGMSVALLLATAILQTQGKEFLDIYRRAAKDHPGASLTLIDAERPASLAAMARAVRQGIPILVYIDGNTGAGAAARSANLVDIPFGSARLRVRQGVARFARRMNVPIYPVHSSRPEWRHIHFECKKPLLPDVKPVNTDDLTCTARLYAPLNGLLETAPQEWEGWLYLHGVPSAGQPAEPLTERVVEELYPFAIGEKNYAVHGPTMASFEVNPTVYEALRRSQYLAAGFG